MKRYALRITIDEEVVADNLHQAFDIAAALYPSYLCIKLVDNTEDAADNNYNSDSNYSVHFDEENN